MCLHLFTLLHPAWSCSGFLPGSVSIVTVAVPIKLSWISAGVVRFNAFFFSASNLFMCSPPFSSHSGRLSDRVTHARVHVVWTRPEGAESRRNSSEANAKSRQSSTCRKTDLEDNVLQHPITRPREQSDWTRHACARAELTFWGLFFSLCQFLLTLHQALCRK